MVGRHSVLISGRLGVLDELGSVLDTLYQAHQSTILDPSSGRVAGVNVHLARAVARHLVVGLDTVCSGLGFCTRNWIYGLVSYKANLEGVKWPNRSCGDKIHVKDNSGYNIEAGLEIPIVQGNIFGNR